MRLWRTDTRIIGRRSGLVEGRRSVDQVVVIIVVVVMVVRLNENVFGC